MRRRTTPRSTGRRGARTTEASPWGIDGALWNRPWTVAPAREGSFRSPCHAAVPVPVVVPPDVRHRQDRAPSVLVLELSHDGLRRGLDLIRVSQAVADRPPV
jgi:hypothetical protein